MTEYERGFIDGVRSKVTAELTPTIMKMTEGLSQTIQEAVKNVMANVKITAHEPEKEGYWEEISDYGGWGDTHYRCSVCGEEWYLEDGKPKDNNMNFCPRCGAKMDAEPDEPWQSE